MKFTRFVSGLTIGLGVVFYPLSGIGTDVGPEAVASTISPSGSDSVAENRFITTRSAIEIAQAEQTQRLPLVDNPIEVRLTPSEIEAAPSYTFSANENETVVIYLDTYLGSWQLGFLEDTLRDAQGNTMRFSRIPYENLFDLGEIDGTHIAYRIPETGLYTVTLSPEMVGTEAREDDAAQLIRVRVADLSERLMMVAGQQLNDEDYLSAADYFGQAISYSPERSGPYVGRLLSYAAHAYETNEEVLEQLESLEAFSAIYSFLSEEQQSVVLSDLRQITTKLSAEAERSEIDLDGLDPQIAEDLAVYLETGVETPALREAANDFW